MKENKIISNKKSSSNKRWTFFMLLSTGFILCISFFILLKTKAEKDAKMMQDIIIVIDAGHGGNDPGKISANGILEKDINLSIAQKLNDKLLEEGFSTIMTREDDNDVADDTTNNRKKSDMYNRVSKINSSGASYMISIHQNSFTDNSVRGAQVFYYATSEQSKRLAQRIQDEIRGKVDKENNRQIKTGNDYFILRKSKCPGVIVECGFLSNTSETQKLLDENYQSKLVDAITTALKQEIKK